MPIDEPVFFRRSEEYPERFAELLGTAVSDRLRTNKVSVFMSGGLDSSALAAVASELLRQRGAEAASRRSRRCWMGSMATNGTTRTW